MNESVHMDREMMSWRREEFLLRGPACTTELLIPGRRLTFLEESSSESDAEARFFLDFPIKKDFLVLLPKNFLFFGEKDDAWRELSELLSIPMATRAFEREQKQLMSRLFLPMSMQTTSTSVSYSPLSHHPEPFRSLFASFECVSWAVVHPESGLALHRPRSHHSQC